MNSILNGQFFFSRHLLKFKAMGRSITLIQQPIVKKKIKNKSMKIIIVNLISVCEQPCLNSESVKSSRFNALTAM